MKQQSAFYVFTFVIFRWKKVRPYQTLITVVNIVTLAMREVSDNIYIQATGYNSST